MATHNVTIALSSLFCYHGGDEDGDSEPYLWTIMYKIDGSCITQEGTALKGAPQYFLSPGSQGNLHHSIGTGGTLRIPNEVGRWTTSLQPILITNPISGNVIEVPGSIGVIAVLMEENATPNEDMEAGHQALIGFVQKQLKAFIDSINLLGIAAEMQPRIAGGASERDALVAVLAVHQKPFKDNLTDLTKAVTFYGVLQSLGIGGGIVTGIDRDDYQGTYFNVFTQDDLARTSANPAQSQMKPLDIFEFIADPGTTPGASFAYNLHGAAWREVRVSWLPITSDLPPGRWQISGVRKGLSHTVGQYIASVGGHLPNGDPWSIDRGRACDLIVAGTHSFFVVGDDGAQADVIATDELNTGHLYLKTVGDGTRANNLRSLPLGPMALVHEEDV